MRYYLIFFIYLIPILAPFTVSAASVCYDEKYYPAIAKLTPTNNGFKAMLGGLYTNIKTRETSVLTWDDNDGWVSLSKEECRNCITPNHSRSCELPLPGKPTGSSPYESHRSKGSSCDYKNEYVWYGEDFYQGEGESGTGGISRYRPSTRQLVTHRPTELKNVPTQKIVHDGKYLWGATAYNFECLGQPPALGLFRYEWEKKEFKRFTNTNEGPCGFVIHDLLWKKGSLWVATDVALSRWIKGNNKWIHYLPDRTNPMEVSAKSCSEIYDQLLTDVPKDKSWFDESRSYHQILLLNLKRFKPDYYNRIKANQ